jgi:hypothetical protein
MLPAIGAASLALDAIQSLMSPSSSSSSQQAGAFGPALSDVTGSSAPPANPAPVSGFTGSRISSGNITALLDAQSLTSANSVDTLDAGGSISDSSQASGTASSAYSAMGQLAQSMSVPLGLNPFSVSV